MTPATPTESPPRLYALVPCAGSGVRAGTTGPKQYAALAGQSLIAHTLHAVSQVQRLTHTLIVLSPDDREFERHARHDVDWIARSGGATRARTVASGLAELAARGARSRLGARARRGALSRAPRVDRCADRRLPQ